MTDEVKIRENSEWYYANLASLLPKYEGRYVAVANRSLFGDYGECADGVRAVESAGFPRGTFIVHKCVPLEQERREWYFRTNRLRHKEAHIHAWYAGHVASFNARTGTIFAKGKNGFPRKQAGWIKTWIEIHQDEISTSWELLKRGINPPEIAPLGK